MAFSMNSGYSGWSMSVRAAQAYEDGEMPKSKWTKKAMLVAIEGYCDEFDLVFPSELLNAMRKSELFERFFELSSWHHTSKYCNETDFYSINEEAVCDVAPEMGEEEREARRLARVQAWEAAQREREEALSAGAEKERRFRDAHRGISEAEVGSFSPRGALEKLLSAYPELFGDPRPSRSGKSSVRDTAIEGAVLVDDGHGLRWSRYVSASEVIAAMETADRGLE